MLTSLLAVPTWLDSLGWLVLGILALIWELLGVRHEKQGFEPLTRIMRDRLMRRHTLIKLAFLLGWAWLGLHWLVPLHW